MEIKFIGTDALRFSQKDCEQPFIEIPSKDFVLLFSDTKPIEGFVQSKDFPQRGAFYDSIYKAAKARIAKFPNCCEAHKSLKGQPWFKKSDYEGLPTKLVNQLAFTLYHISKKSNAADWYKDITDYFEYNIHSFGQFPDGFGPPLGLDYYYSSLIHWLRNAQNSLPAEKRTKLVAYLERPANKQTPKTDLSLLQTIYQKWLTEFPFELNEYFGTLKLHYEKRLLIFYGPPEVNIYSGATKLKVHSKSSLIEFLKDLTNDLLTKLNGVVLYEKGLIIDANEIKLALVINNRKFELKKGYRNPSRNEEYVFRKMIKKWFKDEKKFIDEITPLLKALPPKQTETKTEQLKASLGKYGFFDLPLVKPLKTENKDKLVELISSNDLPYSIAMFDYLGYLKHLENEHLQTKYKLNREISKWFDSDKEGRRVKGNISSLLPNTTESKERYTAHLHKETVKKDYQKLK